MSDFEDIADLDDVEIITVVVRNDDIEIDAGAMSPERALYLMFQALMANITSTCCTHCPQETED